MDKKFKKEENKSDFFIKKHNEKNESEKKEKPRNKEPRLSFKANNKNNRIKRSDLIAEKEKLKLKHKFNKMMRKENKNQDDTKKSVKNVFEEVYAEEKPRTSQSAERKDFDKHKNQPKPTANKRAQLEYERKLKQKEKEREVSKTKLIKARLKFL